MGVLEEAWSAVLGAARVAAAEDRFLKGPDVHWDGTCWHTYPQDGVHVRFSPGIDADLNRLIAAWSSGEGRSSLRDRLGDNAIREEVLRRAGQLAATSHLLGSAAPGWPQISSEISRALSVAVVAVPIGGVFNTVVDERGDAAPVSIGTRAVVGHLDESFQEAAGRLAQRAGLPGFRFSDESWWTEDLVAAQRDPWMSEELMDRHDEERTWPWLVAAWAVPVSGVVAEEAAISASEALLGALILLSHPPGTYWGGVQPWIPGRLSRVANPCIPSMIDSDNTIDTAPQRVDGRLERLDWATTSGMTVPSEIEIGLHTFGPASNVLATVADAAAESTGAIGASGRLASACRMALHAAAATASDVRIVLATKAVHLLIDAAPGPTGRPYNELSELGYKWRTQNDGMWPPCRVINTPQPLDSEHWRRMVPTAVDLHVAWDNADSSPSWAFDTVEMADLALNGVQACLFGVAALLAQSAGQPQY